MVKIQNMIEKPENGKNLYNFYLEIIYFVLCVSQLLHYYKMFSIKPVFLI